MGRKSRNDAGTEVAPSYATLCTRAMGSSPSASHTACLDSPAPGILAHTMQLLKQRLKLQAFIMPTYRGASWRGPRRSSTLWNNVEILKPIDEVIEVINENDKYGPREVFEEPDADDKWARFVDSVHSQRQAEVWNTHCGRVMEYQS